MNKQHILEEIKRTAKENGGVPLGTRAFAAETGVKESDWLGRHWPRWGDAVREAGFIPNEITKAYDREWLITKVIELARELRRFPVQSDLRMKANNAKGFPHPSTLNRLGGKREMVATVAEYCRAKEGYDDVLAMCATASKPAPAPQPEDDDSNDDVEFGFVYLLRSGRFYKVGRSSAAGRRERELAIQLPEKAALVHQIRTDDPPGIEAYWHKRFEARRKNGEWFDLTAADVKAFKRRKFM